MLHQRLVKPEGLWKALRESIDLSDGIFKANYHGLSLAVSMQAQKVLSSHVPEFVEIPVNGN